MSADLLVIVPTRGRPDNLRRALDAWDATGAWDCAALLAAVDADDPQIDGYRQLAAQWAGSGRVSLFEIPVWQPMVAKLDAAAVDAADAYFALGFMGDDHLPRTKGWAQQYLATLRELGTGIVYGNDMFQGERLPTQWAMTADIVRELGRMVPAPVDHLWSDNSILALGAHARCLRYLPDVIIQHCHPFAGSAEWDGQYRRVNSDAQIKRDKAAYVQWVRTQLMDDVAKVRQLREVACQT